MADPHTGRRALVIGAGIGGLTAVRALSDRFETVIVLDRDELAATAGPRAGTPQGRYVLALLAGGLRALAELFPDIEDDLLRAGAVPLSGHPGEFAGEAVANRLVHADRLAIDPRDPFDLLLARTGLQQRPVPCLQMWLQDVHS